MIIRACLLSSVFLFCLALPVQAWADEEQKRDPRLSESPNGARESRLHAETIAESLARYHSSTDQAFQRFEKAAKAHIDRYIKNLDLVARQLTRSDKLDEAADVNNRIFAAQQWAVTPPDLEGDHFLSEADLTTGVSELVGKRGSELIELVDRSAATYVKQAELAYKRFADQVKIDRKAYTDALESVLNIEHLAGRVEAFRQVQAEIKRVSNLPQAERPQTRFEMQRVQAKEAQQTNQQAQDFEIDLFPDVQANNGAAEGFRGFFVVDYHKPNGQETKFSYMIELTKDAGKLHAAKWNGDKGKWGPRPYAITIIERRPGEIFYQHGTQGGKTAIHRLTFKNGKPARDELWWNEDTYRNGDAQEIGQAQTLGTPVADLQDLPDGELFADVLSSRSADGKPQARKGRYRLLIRNGVITMAGTKWDRLNGPWQPMVPRVMKVEPAQGGYILRYDERTSKMDHVFALDMPGDAIPSLRIWWKSGNHDRGQQPDANASLNGKWLVDLARKGLQNQ